MHILCEGRTKAFYKAFWSYVKQNVPEVESQINYVICDYERALISATRESLPAVQIRGCWIHYIKVSFVEMNLLKVLEHAE